MEDQNPQSPIINTQSTQPQNIPAEPQPVPPPINPHNSMNWLKLLIGAIVVLLVVAIFGVGNYLLGSNKNSAKVATQITPTPTPTPASNAADATANWKIVRTSFADFKIPQNWNLWKCNNQLYLVTDWGSQKNETEGCPFDGDQLLKIEKSTSLYSNLNEVIPKSEVFAPTGQLIAISEVEYLLVDGRKAVKWKRNLSSKEGGETQGNGTRIHTFILPNISISIDSKEESNFKQILSTFKFTK